MNIIHRMLRKVNILLRRTYYRIFTHNIIVNTQLNFRKDFEINVEKNALVSIGNNVFFNNGCSINAHKSIKIGNDCIFGENVKLYDHNHIFSDLTKPISKQGFKCQEIVIGNNCWIGSNVVILAGTKLGNHVVIGAGCVISGEIASNTIIRISNCQNQETIRGG